MREPPMNDHTVKSFDEQLQALSAAVAQMGGLDFKARSQICFGWFSPANGTPVCVL